MAATGAGMAVLESRIKSLEDRIFGKECGPTSQGDTPEVLAALSGVRQSLTGLTTGKERIHSLWKRMEELNSNLDPEVTEKLTLTESAKADIILAEEEQLKTIAGLLEKLQSLKDTMDSEHTKGPKAFTDKLQPLVTVQLDQRENAVRQNQEVNELLEVYNNTVTLLSQQFVQWDAVMTRYEIAKKVREPKEYY